MKISDDEKLMIRTGINVLEASTNRTFNRHASLLDWIEHAKKMEVTIKATCKLIAPIAVIKSNGEEHN
jgi:hypothetical protein